MSSTEPNQLLPVLQVYPRDLSPYVMVVGDPNRVRQAAALMTDARQLGSNREYLTMTGEFAGQPITIVSHGVGAGGANICFMELLQGGARVLIRAGTCGGLHESVDDGDLIIATGAVREDAVTEQLMPLAYPAIADRGLVEALIQSASRHNYTKPHIGLAVTGANLYSTPLIPPPWQKYAGYGVLAIEMELAALLVLAQMHGARAGGIFVSDGNLVRTEATSIDSYDPHRAVVENGKQSMLKVALDALAATAAAEASTQ